MIKQECNNLVRISAGFDKNPVGTYDETVLTVLVEPVISFPFPIQHLLLSFSDESMNKVLTLFAANQIDDCTGRERDIFGEPPRGG